MCRSKEKKYIRERSLSVDEGLEYMTATGKRKEELERKMNKDVIGLVKSIHKDKIFIMQGEKFIAAIDYKELQEFMGNEATCGKFENLNEREF